MSEPQQPPVPPSEQASPAFPPAPPAAAPQQPAAQPAQPHAAQAAQLYPAQHQPQATPQPAYPPTMQPQAGQQPYPSYAGDRAAGGGNSLGRVAFIVAAITLGLELLSILLWPILYSAGGIDVAELMTTALRLLTFAGFATALVLGILALRREKTSVLAGIAIGVSGAALLGLVVTLISQLFYNLI